MPREPRTILTVNAGSSSVRLALFQVKREDVLLLRSTREATPEPRAVVLERFLAGDDGVAAVAHRIVHGGTSLHTTCEIDAAVTAEVARVASLAPLHNPAALTWVDICRQRLPAARGLAVFDTEFFADLPEVAATYALPTRLRSRWGLRRLGFHGLAHRSMLQAFARLAPARCHRVITLQLGSGCSMAAILDRRAVDTSMGFTPLEGLVMGSRCGDLDPGVVLFLSRYAGMDHDEIERVLNDESGLLGLSGISSDFRALLEDRSPAARLALDVFCYRVRKYVGAYVAVLGGCDALLVGGGAGEHLPELRSRMLAGLEGLGLVLDGDVNAGARAPGRITSSAGSVEGWVVPTDEERVLAEEAARHL
jgi:acetate kinase